MNSKNPRQTNSPYMIEQQDAVNDCQQAQTDAVSADLQDGERERHIASCGYLMLAAYRRYEQSSCLGDLGEAHRWKGLMEDAIKSRSPARVARMEAARGLT